MNRAMLWRCRAVTRSGDRCRRREAANGLCPAHVLDYVPLHARPNLRAFQTAEALEHARQAKARRRQGRQAFETATSPTPDIGSRKGDSTAAATPSLKKHAVAVKRETWRSCPPVTLGVRR